MIKKHAGMSWTVEMCFTAGPKEALRLPSPPTEVRCDPADVSKALLLATSASDPAVLVVLPSEDGRQWQADSRPARRAPQR